MRILSPTGYAPVPKGPEHKYDYLTRTFVKDPSYHEPRWEQNTSALLIARSALFFNKLFGNPDRFDLTLFGLAQGILFLSAIGRLLHVIKGVPGYRVIWIFILLVLTDVGYVAYLNSLYTEPSSCIWFLFLLAESIHICRKDRPDVFSMLRWGIFAVLWVTAKIQNAGLSAPLLAYGLTLVFRARPGAARYIGLTGLAAILASGIYMYTTVMLPLRVTAMYNLVFYAILPESANPTADLQALGLNPDYAKYSGTVAWSPGTGIADGYLVIALETRLSSWKLFGFYLTRPSRMLLHVRRVLANAFSLRPEYCGNYDRSSGHSPGDKNWTIALWSRFHERILLRAGLFALGMLVLAVIGCLASIAHPVGKARTVRRWLELGGLLGSCCIVAFVSSSFGDSTYDNVKHQFLFNLLFDACIGYGIAGAISITRSRKIPA